ncbi:site-specific integrase [Mucilaginibacter daejeonensis]|uniref:tyrosine-type recombinase/integrase n=1 Tax=Mucilaginibacter daejeonensis TaxID=398049 RepID=UPI001D172F03|nr:site-specific integrase [Mucilaginibacter daejeonensis]UEG52587.1 site-specific integrase [Mucilaginibacter daejeonensis]
MTYTAPSIVTSDDLRKKSYITFYYGTERVRKYSAQCLNLKIEPNRAKSVGLRNELLERLRFEYHKALDAGTYGIPITNSSQPSSDIIQSELPHSAINEPEAQTTQALLQESLNEKLNSDLSRSYKRDLKTIHKEFLAFLTDAERVSPINDISTARVQKFLSRYGSSGTYYMNKRRNLAVLFNFAAGLEDKQLKTVKATSRRKSKAKLHEKYEKQQLKPILEFLKEKHFNLYVCCLLTYSSWLRPHEEIRLLTPHDFKKGLTEVHLTGAENKGRQVRIVHIPEYARDYIAKMLTGLQRNDNLFSRCPEPFNESYFNTAWSRMYKKMAKVSLIHENQTIYSFRHTAAVEVYRRTKDVHLLQKLLGHSSIVVTLKYLRSLGELNSEEMKNAAPQLDI